MRTQTLLNGDGNARGSKVVAVVVDVVVGVVVVDFCKCSFGWVFFIYLLIFEETHARLSFLVQCPQTNGYLSRRRESTCSM